MNALNNIKNPYQTNAKRVLCVCSAGLLRSPTAANVLHKEFGYNTRAAGITSEYALIPVTDLLLHWADEIVCMERWQAEELKTRENKVPVFCLYVPDKFPWNDEELQKFILEAYKNRVEEAV